MYYRPEEATQTRTEVTASIIRNYAAYRNLGCSETQATGQVAAAFRITEACVRRVLAATP